jgi:hypothetical protein
MFIMLRYLTESISAGAPFPIQWLDVIHRIVEAIAVFAIAALIAFVALAALFATLDSIESVNSALNLRP